MQILIIAGTVGKDAELRRTQSGDAVLGFSLAVDNGKDASGNKRPATWYDCSIWGKRAESLANYIHKGDRLTLQGRPTAREHGGKAYLGISVNELSFQGSSGGGQQRDQDQGYGQSGNGGGSYNDLDDSIPF